MTQDSILTEIDHGVGLLTFNRPTTGHRLDVAMLSALREVLAQWQADPRVQLVVLGAQGAAFCRGAEAPADEVLVDLLRFPKPLLARIHGEVVGLGAALIASCDIAVATIDSRFMLREPLPLSSMGQRVLARVMGERPARRFLLTGEAMSAVEARRLGLVDEVVADEAALDDALADLIEAIMQANDGWCRQLSRTRGESLCSSS